MRAPRWLPAAMAAALPSCQPFADLHFLAVADWGGLPVWPYTTPAQRKVAAALGNIAEAHDSAFALSLGDHFYYHGVRSADDPRWRRTFERVYTHDALRYDGFWRAVAGNHDHLGNISGQLEYAARPNSAWHYPALQYRWRETLPDEAGTTVEFILIDTYLLCGGKSERQRPPRGAAAATAEKHWEWLEAALAESHDADYLVVGGHYPVHSPARHGPTAYLRRRLEPLLRKHRASVYFSGHDHALFHIGPPLNPSAPQYHGVGAGVVTSSSARHLHTVPHGHLRFHARGKRKLHGKLINMVRGGGFAAGSVSAQGLTVTHYDGDGNVLHAATVPPRRRLDVGGEAAQGECDEHGAVEEGPEEAGPVITAEDVDELPSREDDELD